MTIRSDTIFALSSGAPPAGVAVVRVSGPAARGIAKRLTGDTLLRPRRASLRWLVDPVTATPIDQALVVWFPHPHSFTGEDVVEFHVHGGRAVVAALAKVLAAAPGLRLAEPGEFTRRAFLAGRLDLTEVEGLADLLAAETEHQRRQALRQAGGQMRAVVEDWAATLLRARAMIEAELDFSDEEGVTGAWSDALRGGVARVAEAMETILLASGGERVRDGFTVVIVGAPNAGKSSLLNRLAGRDAAIVAAEPGTTRDLVEVDLDIAGHAVRLVDTAGLRAGGGAVEQEGMRRARLRATEADLALWLWSDPAATIPDGLVVPVLVVATKADLFDSAAERFARAHSDYAVSAVSGAGVSGLIEAIGANVVVAAGPYESRLITRERHRLAIADSVSAVREAIAEPPPSPEIVAEALRSASDALGRVTGRVDVEDVLDLVFREFCIGK